MERSKHRLTANKKDLSLSSEMTIWGKRHSRISLLPSEGGAPKGAEVGCRYELNSMCGASHYPLSSPLLPDRKRKRSIVCARNDNMGKATLSYLPPSSGRRCPEGAEVGCRYELNSMCGASRYPLSSPLLPDRKQKRSIACARNDTEESPRSPTQKIPLSLLR